MIAQPNCLLLVVPEFGSPTGYAPDLDRIEVAPMVPTPSNAR